MLSIFLLLAALASVIVWLLREPLFRGWQRARVRSKPFPPEWRDILRRRVPLVSSLPADLQLQLKKHIQVFVAEKPFIGCAGLEVTEEMRVVVAAQACLLLLNRRTDYFPGMSQVLLYPSSFLVRRERTDALGLMHDDRRILAGESWSIGQVVLSWDDVVRGAADPGDGRNVVIHEFAHQLDQETGGANGAPLIAGGRRQRRWAFVMGAEYAGLTRRLADGVPSMLDAYAATSPAEFFAVASEEFFERPSMLAAEHPDLFAVLSDYFQLRPQTWS